MFKRLLDLPYYQDESFFLWGPRQSGKSTLLRSHYSDVPYIDLLKSDEYARYLRNPELLREEVATDPHCRRIVIDEIQKVPALLDEVHWLIENKAINFCLCGSSARKLKRGQANLLGGRALKAEMFGLVSEELRDEFDLMRLINFGYLPRHYLKDKPKELLRSYVSDYLKEEIAEEGLVRNLPAFANFLNMASFSDCDIVNFSNIARDCGVSSHTTKEYFQILVDTLLGRWVPAYSKRPKRRVKTSPKFYFSDVGVVNHLAKRGEIQAGSELFGKAFENFICHELHAHSNYQHLYYDISYWQLSGGMEVDFILNDMQVAIEVKSSSTINNQHLKSLRNLSEDYTPDRRIVVCTEKKARRTSDDIEIYPYRQFLEELWQGSIIG